MKRGHRCKRVKRVIPEIARRRASGQPFRRIARDLRIAQKTVFTVSKEQAACDAAHFALLLDSAFQYGLIEYEGGGKESGVDTERAWTMLQDLKSRGFIPTDELMKS